MDENGLPIPPDDFLSRSALERTSADIDPPPDPCRNDPADAPSTQQLFVPIAEQTGHERIGVGDFSADGVQDKHAVVGGLEKPAVADF